MTLRSASTSYVRLVLMCALAADMCVGGTAYATWLMIWNGHDQAHWWKPDQYCGARIWVGGKWQATDWADNAQINEYLDNVKAAGITVVIVDLTNGWGWLNDRVHYIQKLCKEKGMLLCVAHNNGGSLATFETHAGDVWRLFAGPSAPYAETYLKQGGRPVLVEYCIRPQFEAMAQGKGTNRQHFTLVWASGEDSNADKWGWQLEPMIGPVPSSNAMFVTSSVKWNSKDEDAWRKSIAWLDYGFLAARAAKPAIVVVGSYDDIHERNSWLVADTSGSIRGRQMRDIQGAVSLTAHYERVKQWIKGKPAVVPGGILADGCYRITNVKTGTMLSCGGKGDVGAPTVHGPAVAGLTNHVWLYHLGKNSYRLVQLCSGLSLAAKGNAKTVVQDWDDNVALQRWKLVRKGSVFTILNEQSRMALEAEAGGDSGAPVEQGMANGGARQQWRFEPVATIEQGSR